MILSAQPPEWVLLVCIMYEHAGATNQRQSQLSQVDSRATGVTPQLLHALL